MKTEGRREARREGGGKTGYFHFSDVTRIVTKTGHSFAQPRLRSCRKAAVRDNSAKQCNGPRLLCKKILQGYTVLCKQ
jgi:hypothetical protein